MVRANSMVRTKHPLRFKAMVAIKPIKGEKTISRIVAEYSTHPQQVRDWRMPNSCFTLGFL